jgi:hypothetical protein
MWINLAGFYTNNTPKVPKMSKFHSSLHTAPVATGSDPKLTAHTPSRLCQRLSETLVRSPFRFPVIYYRNISRNVLKKD